MKLMTMTVATAALAFIAEPASAHQDRHETQHQHSRVAYYQGSSTYQTSNTVTTAHRFAQGDGARRTFAARHLAHHYAEAGGGSQRTYRSVHTSAASAYALAPST